MNNKTFSQEQSSTVDRMRYLPDHSILEVTFRTGKVYRYFKIPQNTWDAATQAESIGKFLNTEIKGKFTYKLMN